MFEVQVPGAGCPSSVEVEIMSATFDVIWGSYSISVEDYKKRDEREDFEINLRALVESCGESM